MQTILLTGFAGFIGFHLTERLLSEGWQVIGLDSFTDYGSRAIKELRAERLRKHPKAAAFRDYRCDLNNDRVLQGIMVQHEPQYVVHLAAQAGVRYSLENPMAYLEANLRAFLVLLEACRFHQPEHLIFASSSSVYGLNETGPFVESEPADHPTSLYAASKRSDELIAHSYAHLFGIPCTGLRFFTVYGPWGRPDMAYFTFTRHILNGTRIPLYNQGALLRDFTYIDDIVEAIVRLLPCAPGPQTGITLRPDCSSAPFAIYNIGRGQPCTVRSMLDILESHLGIRALTTSCLKPPSDGVITHANTEALCARIAWQPQVSLATGLKAFTDWFLENQAALNEASARYDQPMQVGHGALL